MGEFVRLEVDGAVGTIRLDRPKMMSVGMHCRLLGKPGRIGALRRFLDHVQSHDAVWIARRIDIARHWRAAHPHAPVQGGSER